MERLHFTQRFPPFQTNSTSATGGLSALRRPDDTNRSLFSQNTTNPFEISRDDITYDDFSDTTLFGYGGKRELSPYSRYATTAFNLKSEE